MLVALARKSASLHGDGSSSSDVSSSTTAGTLAVLSFGTRFPSASLLAPSVRPVPPDPCGADAEMSIRKSVDDPGRSMACPVFNATMFNLLGFTDLSAGASTYIGTLSTALRTMESSSSYLRMYFYPGLRNTGFRLQGSQKKPYPWCIVRSPTDRSSGVLSSNIG